MATLLRVYLTDDERQHLLTITRSGTAPARTITRAQMLLLLDRNDGHTRTYGEVAELLHCDRNRVGRTVRRYILEGLHGALHDRPRSGSPPKITGDIEAKLVMLACSDPPDGHQRWTLRLLAEQMVVLGYVDSISNVTVYHRLKKTRCILGR